MIEKNKLEIKKIEENIKKKRISDYKVKYK